MTTLTDRPDTALLVVDVQNGVVGAAHDRDAVVARIAGLVDGARTGGVPVVWVQHEEADMPRGSEEWRIVAELQPAETEPVLQKRYGDSFEDSDLDRVLADAAVGRLIVTGAQTDACIRSTIHGAFTRGFDVTLVGDAHTTEDLTARGAPSPAAVIAHTNMYWQGQAAPRRTAAVVAAEDVVFTG